MPMAVSWRSISKRETTILIRFSWWEGMYSTHQYLKPTMSTSDATLDYGSRSSSSHHWIPLLSTTSSMQLFSVPNTDYHTSPASTGIATSTSQMATKNRCYVPPILCACPRIHLTVANHRIAVSDVGYTFTVNYGAENFGIYSTYTPPNFQSMDVAVSHQVILFRATVRSYVTDASDMPSSSKSYLQMIMHKFFRPLHWAIC